MSYAVWILLALLSLLAAWMASEPRRGGARRRRLWQLLGLAALVVLVVAPRLVSFSHQELLVFLAMNVLMVASYRLLALTGEFSLAHVVIMGVGAYASAVFSKRLGVPVPVAMICAAAMAALVAFVLAFPLFRMKGFYFLIGSFAAGEAIRLSWKWEHLRDLFGGAEGDQEHPRVPEHRARRRDHRFLRSRRLLLPGTARGRRRPVGAVARRAFAHRAHLPARSTGRTRWRARSAWIPGAPARWPSWWRPSSPAWRARCWPITCPRSTPTASTSTRWSMC